MPANGEILLKVESVGCLRKLILSRNTCHPKDDCIYQSLIHVGKITLMGQLQDSVVECVDVLTLSLSNLGKLESGHSEITDWLTKFLEVLQNIVDIICLVQL